MVTPAAVVPREASLCLNRVEVVTDKFVHLKHVNLVELEYRCHLFVAYDSPFVCRILEIVGFDMLPQLLDDLRARKLET